jgi:hypothetical protein
MLLRERDYALVAESIKELLLGSNKDVGIRFHESFGDSLMGKFEKTEILATLSYLAGKGYLNKEGNNWYSLSHKGYDEWIFPNGRVEPNKIFLSHASEDRVMAAKIKEELEKNGFNIFVAHDDIPGTEEWREKILSELKVSEIFIALRTKNYSKKSFTEQECGFALAMGKRILSLCVSSSPSEMGFCSAFQGHGFGEGDELINNIVAYCKKQLLNE